MFQYFHDAINAHAYGLQLAGWWVALLVSGGFGCLTAGAIFSDVELGYAPHFIGCVAVAAFAAYKIGGM